MSGHGGILYNAAQNVERVAGGGVLDLFLLLGLGQVDQLAHGSLQQGPDRTIKYSMKMKKKKNILYYYNP